MKVEWKTCLRVGVSTFVLFLAIYYWQGVTNGFALFMSASTPLVIGCIIAYILNIPMSFYERHFFPRSNNRLVKKSRRIICMLGAILTLLGIVAAVVGLVIPELVACIQQLLRLLRDWFPEAVSWVTDFVEDSESLGQIVPQEYLDTLSNINWEEWFSKIVTFLSSGIGGAVGTAVGAITSVFSSVVTFVLGLIFAMYLLLGKDRLLSQTNRMMKCYLPEKWRERISHVCTVLNDCFHRYVVGQCTEAVILGSLCIIGMWIFRFPYATMIGTLVGFTALIPVAGAYIGAVVGAIMILTVSPLKAVLFVIFLTVLQQLEGNLIYPRVVGTSIGLPGLWVLAAVTVGGGLMGIAGMLIGVPLTAAIYRLVREDVRRRENKDREEVSRRNREKREKKRVKEAKNEEKPGKIKKENVKIESQRTENHKTKDQNVKNQQSGGQRAESQKAKSQKSESQKTGSQKVINQKSETQAAKAQTSGEGSAEMKSVNSGSHSRRRRRKRKSSGKTQQISE